MASQYSDIKFEIKGQIGVIKVFNHRDWLPALKALTHATHSDMNHSSIDLKPSIPLAER